MRIHQVLFTALFAAALLCSGARAESVDETFTHISPKHSPGSGEFVHGQGYGKIMIRLLMFGAIPQQGVHHVPEGTDLLFAVLYAGGYGESTKLDGITIRRRGVSDVIEVDLEDLIEEGGEIPKLKDGDIVNIPFNWRRDYQEFVFFTSIFTSLTGLLLSVTLLAR